MYIALVDTAKVVLVLLWTQTWAYLEKEGPEWTNWMIIEWMDMYVCVHIPSLKKRNKYDVLRESGEIESKQWYKKARQND